MDNRAIKIRSAITGVSLAALISCGTTFASTIDPNNQYAWSENSGWLNFAATNGQVRVFKDHLEGYVWAENVGWIKLGSHTVGGAHSYANNSKDNWGVNNDAATSKLSGYAWSENAGWINFSSPNGGPVTVNADTGKFDGYAWSENLGWVHLANTSPAYGVNLADADLLVTKEAASNPVTPGDDLVYTITVTNNGQGAADNIQLQDKLPAGLTYKTVDNNSCSHVSGTVTCTLDSLAAGKNAVIELTVGTDTSLEEELTNTAVASLYGPDANPDNNSGSDTTYFGLGDMACSGYDAKATGNFGAGFHLCIGRNTLKTVGEVNVQKDAIVYFQSPATTLDKEFKVHPEAAFTVGKIGNATPHISGPAELDGTPYFADTHTCEDYEDGVLEITPTLSDAQENANSEIYTLSCTDDEGKTVSKQVTVYSQ